MSLLDARRLRVTFGGLVANDSIDLTVEPAQLVGLIGPNGAGKTTFIDAATGFVPLSGGQIDFDGRRIDEMAPHRRARAGLGRTWQSLELFSDLSVRENLAVAAERTRWWTPLADAVHRRGSPEPAVETALGLLGLTPLADRGPDELSQGQRKLVGVARALAAGPKVVCLDEPAAGLDAEESRDLGRQLRQVVNSGTGVLLVDHDMSLVLAICDFVYVLEFGAVIAKGPPKAVRNDERVITAYLGEGARKARLADTDLADTDLADTDLG